MPDLTHLPAPAKLNLFLHVTGRRADGYHLLQSVFILLDWADEIHIEDRQDGLIRRHDLGPSLPDEDLCIKAARLLQKESGTSHGCDISINKQVPWGAGLGGGSSDAATVLIALNKLWHLNWTGARLEQIGLRLGADVPFFLRGKPAWVEGIGESISPLELPAAARDTPLAVLKPPVSVPTSAIFSSPALKRDTKPAIVADFLAAPKRFGKNDLQAPAELYSSEVSQALGIMQKRFGNSRMTGSGSAVFSWVEPDANGQSIQSFTPVDVGLNDSAWVGRLCCGLVQHPLLDWLV
ncbi:MAG TPA: 4-(cytidine 5'-diphospho)-2-C-methyl-D-erythritol kinase [Aquabacterium sp.]|nr:4-(cytidine 5'-diphospho)-2-C-methyl-D-erythritol kinase [Aquabacterium sp.]